MDEATRPRAPGAVAQPDRYAVLVPVKPPAVGKTRLDSELRAPLVRAFALDVLAAAARATRVRAVYLVSADHDLRTAAEAVGARTLPDHGRGDLNLTLSGAVDELAALDAPEDRREAVEAVGAVGPVAALLGDLPCLLAADLDDALAAAAAHPAAFVPDADGTGTTLVAATGRLRTRFGPGSRQAHLDIGLTEVARGATTLRRDVDTLEDLARARALGLGEHTSAVLGGRREDQPEDWLGDWVGD